MVTKDVGVAQDVRLGRDDRRRQAGQLIECGPERRGRYLGALVGIGRVLSQNPWMLAR